MCLARGKDMPTGDFAGRHNNPSWYITIDVQQQQQHAAAAASAAASAAAAAAAAEAAASAVQQEHLEQEQQEDDEFDNLVDEELCQGFKLVRSRPHQGQEGQEGQHEQHQEDEHHDDQHQEDDDDDDEDDEDYDDDDDEGDEEEVPAKRLREGDEEDEPAAQRPRGAETIFGEQRQGDEGDEEDDEDDGEDVEDVEDDEGSSQQRDHQPLHILPATPMLPFREGMTIEHAKRSNQFFTRYWKGRAEEAAAREQALEAKLSDEILSVAVQRKKVEELTQKHRELYERWQIGFSNRVQLSLQVRDLVERNIELCRQNHHFFQLAARVVVDLSDS